MFKIDFPIYINCVHLTVQQKINLRSCFYVIPSMRIEQNLEDGFNVLAGAPQCSLLPEIAIRTFRVLRPIGENGAMQ